MTTEELQQFWTSRDRPLVVKRYAMMLAAGFILGVVGPYDTSNMPEILIRFGYWLSLLWLASFFAGPIARWYFPRFPNFNHRVSLALFGLCVAVSLPIFLIVMAMDVFGNPEGQFSVSYVVRFFVDFKYGIIGLIWWFFQVFIITFIAFGAASLAYSAFLKDTMPATSANPAQRFLNRLPSKIGTDLKCITVEDHYIRVYTALGDAMILMRLADAISELDGFAGTQVHRSWWVAYSAIEHISKDKRRYTIQISCSNGEPAMRVPVSQSHVEKLQKGGFL